jgi:hypothetical protein
MRYHVRTCLRVHVCNEMLWIVPLERFLCVIMFVHVCVSSSKGYLDQKHVCNNNGCNGLWFSDPCYFFYLNFLVKSHKVIVGLYLDLKLLSGAFSKQLFPSQFC